MPIIAKFHSASSFLIPKSKVSTYAFTNETRCKFVSSLAKDYEDVRINQDYSLIVTCRNEASNIIALLESVLAQSVCPYELVICDGGSTDSTCMLIKSWYKSKVNSTKRIFKLNLIEAEKCSIAEGRNRASAESKCDILLFTDAGCILHPTWAERLLIPFVHCSEIDAAMGWYEVNTKTRFQKIVSFYILPQLSSLDIETFLPSARSLACRKTIFNMVSGFPTHLTLAGEDTLFDYYLKTVSKEIAFVPDALTIWSFPSTLKSLCKTILNYSKGDGQSGMIFWDYYVKLLETVTKSGFELCLSFLLFIIWKVFDSNLFGLIFILSFILLSYRITSFIYPYLKIRVGVNESFMDKILKLFAVILMTSCQVIGFISGLFSRKDCEKKRILKASKGHVLVFMQKPLSIVSSRKDYRLIESLLSEGLYITIVYSASHNNSYLYPIAHPQMESYHLPAFNLKLWLKKHGEFIKKEVRPLFYLDYCEDAYSERNVEILKQAGASPYFSLLVS